LQAGIKPASSRSRGAVCYAAFNQHNGDVNMKISVKSGASVATLAAALLLAGAAAAPAAEMAADAKGHCVGANSCKGTSACKTAKNECKGHNACKGQGFTESTAADCAKVEGAKFEAAEMKEMKK
jgi:hypothetical protein